MATIGDDCYFFYTSSCAKGSTCQYRHVEAAKTATQICQHWAMGGCYRPMCRFRHSDFPAPTSTAETSCYWETQPSGCTKPSCPYKHGKPKPNSVLTSGATNAVMSSSQAAIWPSTSYANVLPYQASSDGDNKGMDKGILPEPVSSSSALITVPLAPETEKKPELKAETSGAVNENSNKENGDGNAVSSTDCSADVKVKKGVNKVGAKKKTVGTGVKKTRIVKRVIRRIVRKGKKKVGETEVEEIISEPTTIKESEEAGEKSQTTTDVKEVVDILGASDKQKVEKPADTSESKQVENAEMTTIKETPVNTDRIEVNKKQEIIHTKNESMSKDISKTADNPRHDRSRRSTARKTAKERLGLLGKKKADGLPQKDEDSKSESDSDDSVENIKVLSVEEILRQRALESMMKKRAAEGKPLLATEPVKETKSAAASAIAGPKGSSPRTGRVALNRRPLASSRAAMSMRNREPKPVAPPAESSPDQSESESSESSSSEESEDLDDFEPDVRRVVVDEESEKAARNRAKASLLKKQAASLRGTQTGKVVKAKKKRVDTPGHVVNSLAVRKLKGRMMNVDYDSDDIISARARTAVSVKDRLGKPMINQSSYGFKSAEVTGSSPRKVKVVQGSSDSSAGEEDEEEDGEGNGDVLKGIKVKSLEEIRREKMEKAHVTDEVTSTGEVLSAKQRLGPVSPLKKGEESSSRQVVSVQDSGSKSDDSSNAKPSDVQKRARRRPWRSNKRVVVGSETGQAEVQTGDERTTVVISSHLTSAEKEQNTVDPLREEEDVNESPFARLKRRALMKKIQTLKQSKDPSPTRNIIQESDSQASEAAVIEDDEVKEEEEANDTDGRSSHKKRKHKHKHKHKKSKRERQIYMPPALKNAVTESVSSPSHGSESLPTSSTSSSLGITEATKTAKRRAGPHPIAAAWTAGLNLSSKGASAGRRPQPSAAVATHVQTAFSHATPVPATVSERLGLKQPAVAADTSTSAASPTKKPVSVANPPTSSGGVTIKSFSEIMAEKRQRRLELQAKKQGTGPPGAATLSAPSAPPVSAAPPQPFTRLPTSAPNSSPVQPVEPKARVPISPIVFNSGGSSSPLKSRLQQTGAVSHAQPKRLPQQAVSPVISFELQSSTILSSQASNPSSITMAPPSSLPSPTVTESQGTLIGKQKAKVSKDSDPAAGSKKVKQKKLFKRKKSMEKPTAAPAPAPPPPKIAKEASTFMIGSHVDISIPLPPMTLEEELELDEDDSFSLEEPVEDKLWEESPPSLGKTGPPHSTQTELVRQDNTPAKQQLTPVVKASEAASIEKTSRSPSTPEDGATMDRSRISIDEELALLTDDVDMENIDCNVDDAKPIDDLLQDLDDLLA